MPPAPQDPSRRHTPTSRERVHNPGSARVRPILQTSAEPTGATQWIDIEENPASPASHRERRLDAVSSWNTADDTERICAGSCALVPVQAATRRQHHSIRALERQTVESQRASWRCTALSDAETERGSTVLQRRADDRANRRANGRIPREANVIPLESADTATKERGTRSVTRPARSRAELPVRGLHDFRRTSAPPAEINDAESEIDLRRMLRMFAIALTIGLLFWAGVIAGIVLLLSR